MERGPHISVIALQSLTHQPPHTTHYSANLIIQRHDQNLVSNPFILSAILYDKIQCIKECRWPWG